MLKTGKLETRKPLFLLAVLLLTAFAPASPRVLIVQTPVKFKGNDNPNRPLAMLLASEFDQAGRLEAIVYSLADPAFRAAVAAGKIAQVSEIPTENDGKVAAKQLGVDYLLLLQTYKDGKNYRAKLSLLKGDKPVWKDEENSTVTLAGGTGADPDSTLRSLASTLMARMNQDPFKALAPKPTQLTPVLDKGQTPAEVHVDPPPPVKKNNAEVLKQASEWIAAGKPNQAVVKLRDAVDADPLDPELRVALVGALLQIDPLAAAELARSSANLLPESALLRVAAARAWIVAGKPDQAQQDLNEAVARDPESVETRLLLGEVEISRGQPGSALEHLEKALAKQDSAEGRFLHALASALLANQAGVTGDFDALQKLEPTYNPLDGPRRYSLATSIVDQAFQTSSIELRSLIQRAVVKADDKKTLDLVTSQLELVKCLAAFCERLPAPPKRVRTNQQRVLALKLLAQTASGIQSYMGGGGEDSLSGARIDLGEAIRNQAELKAAEAKSS